MEEQKQTSSVKEYKFSWWDVLVLIILVISPYIVGGVYNNVNMQNGLVNNTPYGGLIWVIALSLNTAAFIFSLILISKKSKTSRIVGVIFLILSLIYFLIALIGFMLMGLQG
ncbi:MAG TPA: hypothetical protein VMA75_02545 [Candidatus Paceibacterota bacterium]|nr:hypothetical protein [Candidatus Paceibacterota bacterium]